MNLVEHIINPRTTKQFIVTNLPKGGGGSFGPPPHRFSKRLQIKDQALAWIQLWISS